MLIISSVNLMMLNYRDFKLFPKTVPVFSLLMILLFLDACNKKNYSFRPEYQFKSIDKKPNYSDLNYWAAHPWKKDPSDSVPEPLRAVNIPDSSVDVFFIHPTTLTAKNDQRWNADIDDQNINAQTDYSPILYQASVFNEKCRVFAPRYRQAHLRTFFVPDSVAAKYFDIAYTDIKTSFIYYLKNFNNNHPIIIASHSQGTKHAARLLKEFFENKPLQSKLVCAYIIGLPVPVNYFTVLKPCNDSASTGCFVSWRTFKRGYTAQKFVAKENYKSVVINPLTWTNDTTFCSSAYNKGGVLLNFNKIRPHIVNAQIHQNVLWSSKPDIPGKIFLIKKNYHVGDINLFYLNIRQNVATRIHAYFGK